MQRRQKPDHGWPATLALAAGLIVFHLLLVAAVWRGRDIGLQGDDAFYFDAGRRLWSGQRAPDFWAWSPLFVGLHALVGRLPLAPLHAIDVVGALCGAGGSVALWWALRARFAELAAALLAACWSCSYLLHLGGLQVFAFAMVLWTVAAGCFLRRRYGLALLLMVLGAVDRTETGAWLLALAAAAGLFGGRWFAMPGRWRAAFVLTAGTLVALGSSDGARRWRAWLAFGQHYGVTVEQRLGAPIEVDGKRLDPWADWRQVVATRLPGVESLPTALARYPGEILAHAGHNALHTPNAVRRLLFKPIRAMRWPVGLLWLLLVAGWVAALRRRRWRGDLGADGWLLAATAAPLLAVPILLHPRPELLEPAILPFGLLLLLPWASHRPRRLGPAAATTLALGLALVGWLAPAPRAGTGAEPPVRAGTALLSAHPPAGPRLIAVFARTHVLLSGCAAEPVELRPDQGAADALPALLDQAPHASVLLSPGLLPAPATTALADVLRRRGWHVVAERSGCRLFER